MREVRFQEPHAQGRVQPQEGTRQEDDREEAR